MRYHENSSWMWETCVNSTWWMKNRPILWSCQRLDSDVTELAQLIHPWGGYRMSGLSISLIQPPFTYWDYSTSNHIHCFLWDVMTHPCRIFNGGLAKPPLRSCHEWVITFHSFLWMWLLIDTMISTLVWLIYASNRCPWCVVSTRTQKSKHNIFRDYDHLLGN